MDLYPTWMRLGTGGAGGIRTVLVDFGDLNFESDELTLGADGELTIEADDDLDSSSGDDLTVVSDDDLEVGCE